ncbi:hypothetical protein ADUPG1_008493 [Aduncisulcus paluster]|uniref:RecA family profile 1 domain-containing protein n=1 Tax=Aduncisulcus paluster TaxID=2918883 RepID=A0ABQ5KTF7_9EUKA|nr:hypothetical protein ADUPG1_008493 [Aduncisulcus paluster]
MSSHHIDIDVLKQRMKSLQIGIKDALLSPNYSLSSQLLITPHEASKLKQALATEHYDELYHPASTIIPHKIPIQSPILLRLLNGGLAVGKITELVGVAGSGKSNLAAYIASSVVLSGGAAVVITTEGAAAFPFQRMRPAVSHAEPALLPPDSVSRVSFIQALNERDLTTAAEHTESWLAQQTAPRRIVVVDSIAAPYRSEYGRDAYTRAVAMSQFLTPLLSSIQKHNAALLVCNQVRDVIHDEHKDIRFAACPYTPLISYSSSLPFITTSEQTLPHIFHLSDCLSICTTRRGASQSETWAKRSEGPQGTENPQTTIESHFSDTSSVGTVTPVLGISWQKRVSARIWVYRPQRSSGRRVEVMYNQHGPKARVDFTLHGSDISFNNLEVEV